MIVPHTIYLQVLLLFQPPFNKYQESKAVAMADSQRPKVGVGVIIHDDAGNIVMGERAGSHGAGTFQLPGGHLEYGESFAETAAREVLEETGLEVGNIKFLTATNDVFGEGKHYVTIFVTCTITGENKVPQVSPTPQTTKGV
jgi:8-oxo-dGTP diphosphatase